MSRVVQREDGKMAAEVNDVGSTSDHAVSAWQRHRPVAP